jgi:Right handed beta helix region
LILLAAPARAVDRLVPSQFATIRAAVAAAVPGDRILVSSGIYQENVVSTNSNLQFIGKSAVWDGTLTNGAAAACLISTGNMVSVQGFIFRAGAADVPQVQLTGDGCKVSKCSSRGRPAGDFLRMTGNSNVVESCSLFSLRSFSLGSIQIVGDYAKVKKVSAQFGDNTCIGVQGNFATVTSCSITLQEDGSSISITGSNALVSLNMFLYCDSDITVNGANATLTKNKTVRNGGNFISANSSGAGPVVTQNTARHCLGSFLSLSGSNSVVRLNKATDCRGAFLSATSSGAGAVVEQNTVLRCGSTFMTLTGSNSVVRKNAATDCLGAFLSTTSSETGALVEQNTAVRLGGAFLTVSGSNSVVRGNKATDCWGGFLTLTSGQGALVEQNTAQRCAQGFLSVNGADAIVRKNMATDSFGSVSVSGNNAVVDENQLLNLGSISVSGDNLTIRKNTVTGAPNDRSGISASQSTGAGGAVIEDNKVANASENGIFTSCNNAVLQRNRVNSSGTEGSSAFVINGSFNRLTNNVATSGGTHGFVVRGATNTLVNCTATDFAADGFHIEGNGHTLLKCVAMLCSGEGLDNGGTGTTVEDCLFKKNRIDVANDGTFLNAGTFVMDNVFFTGGPTTLPQVD